MSLRITIHSINANCFRVLIDDQLHGHYDTLDEAIDNAESALADLIMSEFEYENG